MKKLAVKKKCPLNKLIIRTGELVAKKNHNKNLLKINKLNKKQFLK